MTATKTRKAWLAHRRKALRKALAMAELTMTEFCERRGYSRTTIYEVLNGKRTSAPADAMLAQFIHATLGVEL